MSYSEQAATMRDSAVRDRAEVCILEQALIFSADGRPDIKALADGIVSGLLIDIEAVFRSTCAGPNWSRLDSDGDLLSAVQGVWPTVAAARYPQEV